jgi:hypothetical protein
MPWELTYLADEEIILLRVTGSYEAERGKDAVRRAVDLAGQHACTRCLVDHREIPFGFGNLDSYERPDLYGSFEGTRLWRLAWVYREIGPDEQFFETACRNRGYNVSVFTDYESALAWLRA